LPSGEYRHHRLKKTSIKTKEENELSVRYDTHLTTCASDTVRKQVVDYLEELRAAGMEIPNLIDGEESGCVFCSADTDLMEKLCERFPDTLFAVDYDTVNPYREYWYNLKMHAVSARYDAPDFRELGIENKNTVDWGLLPDTAAVKTTSGYLMTQYNENGESPGVNINCDGREVVQVSFSEASKRLSLSFSGIPATPYIQAPEPDSEYLVLTDEQHTALRALSDLKARGILLKHGQLKAIFDTPPYSEITILQPSLFPFLQEQVEYSIQDLLREHYQNRDIRFYSPDETCSVLKVDGNAAFAGPVTPYGVLSAHLSNDREYPNISIRCDNVEVARVEYHQDKNELRTYAYGDDDLTSDLEEISQGYVPYNPKAGKEHKPAGESGRDQM